MVKMTKVKRALAAMGLALAAACGDPANEAGVPTHVADRKWNVEDERVYGFVWARPFGAEMKDASVFAFDFDDAFRPLEPDARQFIVEEVAGDRKTKALDTPRRSAIVQDSCKGRQDQRTSPYQRLALAKSPVCRIRALDRRQPDALIGVFRPADETYVTPDAVAACRAEAQLWFDTLAPQGDARLAICLAFVDRDAGYFEQRADVIVLERTPDGKIANLSFSKLNPSMFLSYEAS